MSFFDYHYLSIFKKSTRYLDVELNATILSVTNTLNVYVSLGAPLHLKHFRASTGNFSLTMSLCSSTVVQIWLFQSLNNSLSGNTKQWFDKICLSLMHMFFS